MRRIATLTFFLFCLCIGQAFAGEKILADPAQVVLHKKAVVHLKGSGFAPGQKIAVLFVADDGVVSDIGFALDKEPVADASGTWTAVWKCGRFIKKKIIKAGTYTVKAADTDYNVLAETTVTFVPGN